MLRILHERGDFEALVETVADSEKMECKHHACIRYHKTYENQQPRNW
jgi:hypothetical protein